LGEVDHGMSLLSVAPPGAAPRKSGPEIPHELVTRAMAGDPGAVGHLLAAVRPLVVRYCRARLGRLDGTAISADDVAQEVCIAVLRALPGYRRQGRPFLAFVYGIAAHKALDAHRAATRNRVESVEYLPEAAEPAEGPEQRALRGELSGELGRLLDTLPAKQREILVLRVVLGLSAEETADAVGATAGAVRVAQHRALARLRGVASGRSGAGGPGRAVDRGTAPG
jgi:RNA polymerase sigma-70 factor (ECF subfamily)